MDARDAERFVRLGRLVVWRVEYEQWVRLLAYCESAPDTYTQTEYKGEPAVVAGGHLFIQGR